MDAEVNAASFNLNLVSAESVKIGTMQCYEYLLLLGDKDAAWAEWKSLSSSSKSEDQAEIERHYKNATEASTRLAQHVAVCLECKRIDEEARKKVGEVLQSLKPNE